MKIVYAIYHDWSKFQVAQLAEFGIKVEEGAVRFEIEASDDYEKLKKYLDKWGAHESVGTIYDNKDIEQSNLLVYTGVWVNGHPQPEDIYGYLNLTYDLNNYCKACGIGAMQKEPFRIKKEPKWGEKKMFELSWVFDEVFVQRDIYDDLFKNRGIEFIPVLRFKDDAVIENTVQLKLPVVNVPLKLDVQPSEECRTCGRIKYSPKVKGYFPSFKEQLPGSLHMFKSKEYFGYEAAADRRIFISKEMYLELKKLKIRPSVWAVDKQ